MESGPEVNLSAEEKFQIDQYNKIVKFAEAVLTGSHPRIRIESHCSTGSIVSSSQKNSPPSSPDVEFISANRITTEDTHIQQPTVVNLQDESLNYYQRLGLEFPASHKEVHMAYSRLRLTHNPYTPSGQLRWMGNDLSILYEMENDWKVIKYAHRILNDAEGKRNYDKHLMSLLQNEAPITSTSFPIFPLVQPMSPFVPITDAQRFYSRLPDMSDELEKMIFINNATRGIVIEGSDIDFSRDYYRELGVERGRVRIDTLERTFIYKMAGKGYAPSPQTCKGKLEEQRVQLMWTKTIEAFITLKCNRLRHLYDTGRNNAPLGIAKQRVGAGQARLDSFSEPAPTNISYNMPSNGLMVTPKGPRISTAVGGLTQDSFEAQRIYIQREYQQLESARIAFESLSGQKLPPVAPRMMITPSTPTARQQPLALGPTISFSVRSGIAVGPPPGTTMSISKSIEAARPHVEGLAQPRNGFLGKENQVGGKGKEKEKENEDTGKVESKRSRKRRILMEREGDEDGEVKESRRKRRMYRRRRSSSSDWRDEGRREEWKSERKRDANRLSPVDQAWDVWRF